MQTLISLQTMFAYDFWANRKTLIALRDAAHESAQGKRLFAHILLAEQEWFRRLSGKDSTGFDFWRVLSLADCEKLVEEMRSTYANFLNMQREENLERIVSYKNSKGARYENTVREVLTHVANHSTYHRGQIALTLRSEGSEPAYTDFIAYLRDINSETN